MAAGARIALSTVERTTETSEMVKMTVIAGDRNLTASTRRTDSRVSWGRMTLAATPKESRNGP